MNAIKWRPIYEVKEVAYLKEPDIFLDDFMKQGKDNENEDQFIPLEIKISLSEWQQNNDFMHKWSSYVKRI